MLTSKKTLYFTLGAAVILCLGGLIVLTAPFFGYFADMLYANSSRFDCDNLPPVSQVEEVLREHEEELQQIERADAYVEVTIETPKKCPNKAYILILHATEAGRERIEEIIHDEFFYAIPYLFANV